MEVMLSLIVVAIVFGAIVNGYLSTAIRCQWTAYSLAAQSLEASSLYQEVAQGCRTLDLKSWSHPTRKALEHAHVQIKKVELHQHLSLRCELEPFLRGYLLAKRRGTAVVAEADDDLDV